MTDKKLGVSFEDVGKAGIVRSKNSLNVRGRLQEEGLSRLVTAAAIQVASEGNGTDTISHYCESIGFGHCDSIFPMVVSQLCQQTVEPCPEANATLGRDCLIRNALLTSLLSLP
jgi:hypothetical protein